MFLQLIFLPNQINEKITLKSEYLETPLEKFHFLSISFLVKLAWLYHSAAVICEVNGKAKCAENMTCSLSNKGAKGKCYSITVNTSSACLSICFINSKKQHLKKKKQTTKNQKKYQAGLSAFSFFFD